MGEHKLALGGKLGVPEFHGFAANIEARYEGRWGQRTTDLLTAAADASGLEPAELGAALEANDPASDLLYLALNRAVEVSDPDYVSALGRLVGQALDPARIDETAFLTTELVRLDPIHLRALLMAFVFIADGQNVDDPNQATVAAEVTAQTGIAKAVDAPRIAEHLHIHPMTAKRAADRLVSEDLLSVIGVPGHTQPSLTATPWAGRALLLLFPSLTEVWLGGDQYARR